MIPMFALAGFGVLLGAPFIRRTEFVAFFRMLALTGVLRFSVLIFRTVLPSRFFLFYPSFWANCCQFSLSGTSSLSFPPFSPRFLPSFPSFLPFFIPSFSLFFYLPPPYLFNHFFPSSTFTSLGDCRFTLGCSNQLWLSHYPPFGVAGFFPFSSFLIFL